MKFKRSIDDLGRIVIPNDIRKQLGTKSGDKFNVELDGKKVIITPAESRCVFCGKQTDNNLIVQNLCVCKKCADIIVERIEKS